MMDDAADGRLIRRLCRVAAYRRWILGGTILSSLAALGISLMLPNIYRASTYVLVSEPKIGSALPSGAWQYALIRTYVPFVDSDALISNALRDLRLDQPPYNLTLEKFRKHSYLDVDIPKNTRLLEINVEFPNAQRAADLANYLAQNSVKFNDQVTTSDTEVTQAFLRKRLDQVQDNLTLVERQRLKVKQEARLEEKEKELIILLDEKQHLASQLQQLGLAREQNAARASVLKDQLNSEPRIFSLKKNIFSDPLVHHAATQSGQSPASDLSVTEETVNAAREKLTTDYADALADAHSNRAGVEAGAVRLEKINGEVSRLLTEVARRRSEVESVNQQYAVAREAFETASRDYMNASVTVSAKSQDLKQLAPAVPPEKPVRPRIILNVVLAAILGAALLTLLALARESYRDMQIERFVPEAQDEHASLARVDI